MNNWQSHNWIVNRGSWSNYSRSSIICSLFISKRDVERVCDVKLTWKSYEPSLSPFVRCFGKWADGFTKKKTECWVKEFFFPFEIQTRHSFSQNSMYIKKNLITWFTDSSVSRRIAHGDLRNVYPSPGLSWHFSARNVYPQFVYILMFVNLMDRRYTRPRKVHRDLVKSCTLSFKHMVPTNVFLFVSWNHDNSAKTRKILIWYLLSSWLCPQ